MLKNVRTERKPEKGRYEKYYEWSQSSDVTTFNLYEQDWPTLIDEGLTRIFSDQAEFERLKDERERQNDGQTDAC